MNSFDLFNTLTSARNGSPGEAPIEEHYPIAENVAKVRCGDIIVSDYHTPDKALRILREVCKLDNELIVTEDGKWTGEIWKTVRPSHHTGDNPRTDIATANHHGITTTLTTLWQPTEIESRLSEAGLTGLANLIREARLTLSPCDVQTQFNFPLLFTASILLHRIAVNHSDVLMSSRDCCLWSILQEKIKELLGGTYNVHYFFTSRISRLKASPSYLDYTNRLMGTNPLVVDVSGYGRTLPVLVSKTKHPHAPIYLLTKYPDPEGRVTTAKSLVPSLSGNSYIECCNLAPHQMVLDVLDGTPQYGSGFGVNWEDVPEIKQAHVAFNATLSLVSKHDLKSDFQVSDEQLRNVAVWLFNSHAKHLPAFKRGMDLMVAEEKPILAEMENIGKRPLPKLVVRLHCEMPYFSQIAPADGFTSEVWKTIIATERYSVASNSPVTTADLQLLLNKECFYLPSIYALPPKRSLVSTPGVDHVCCFGRIFNLKNPMVQALAAIRFAKERGNKLIYHINDYPNGGEGTSALGVMSTFFATQPNVQLRTHKWMPHEDFLKMLTTMTVGLQVSMTEASNVLSLDMAAVGIPLVVSREIKWADPLSIAHATDSFNIAERMLYAVNHPELTDVNRANIERHNAEVWQCWRSFLGDTPNPKVLFLVQNPGIDTGISVVTTNDSEMLKQHGVDTVVIKTGFDARSLAKLSFNNYTHVVSEASWAPVLHEIYKHAASAAVPKARENRRFSNR